ncbi:hypothetical protein KEM56_006842, partial [Ascosphaera pollenicola]
RPVALRNTTAPRSQQSKADGPPTPVSPEARPTIETENLSDNEALSITKSRAQQPKNTGAKRKLADANEDELDEDQFRDFNYRLEYVDEYTPERCKELETAYWKNLGTGGQALYGADMPGSLFHESTPCWNVANLPNILNVLGRDVPGVTKAYLYLGMWKATFAWHLEDVDLYSINYIHFGAPKQWYSISQRDAQRFEAAAKSLWPHEAKKCSQFLRHKTHIVSPSLLKSEFNIEVNKLIHYEGEFVITYPYGYHSGFNLGYNCAESVNFATEKWLDYARVAKKCECEKFSVWVDINELERKLRGEPTPEPEPSIDYDSDASNAPSDLLTPPRSIQEKTQGSGKRRKLNLRDARSRQSKSCTATPKTPSCVLCPNDFDYEELLPTQDGTSQAHRTCARYIKETSVFSDSAGNEYVCHIGNIPKSNLGRKCLHCRETWGACFQCTHGKCTRSYHPTCALLAGVQAEVGKVSVLAEDGNEYYIQSVNLKCKFHRPKKSTLAASNSSEEIALNLQRGDFIQYQPDKEIYGAQVLENRQAERLLLLRVLPKDDVVEVPYKFLLVVKKSNFSPLSPSVKPLPADLAQQVDNHREVRSSVPLSGSCFADPDSNHHWAEFSSVDPAHQLPLNVDLSQPERIWHYLGHSSTEYRAQYTENPGRPYHNPRSHFLESVKPQTSTDAAVRHTSPPSQRSPSQCYTVDTAIGMPTPQFDGPDYQQDTAMTSPYKQSPYIKREPTGSPMQLAENIAPFDGLPWGGGLSSQMQEAHHLFTSIVDHANKRAGYQIVDPGFAAQCLLRSVNTAVPQAGIDKLMAAISGDSSKMRDSDDRARLMSLSSKETIDLIRMLHVAVYNFLRHAKESTSGGLFSRRFSRSLSKPAIPNYAYLELQEQNRPAIYQSPYAPGGGFSAYAKEEYKLVEKATPTPKKNSAADFFQSLSAEDQKKILTAYSKEVTQGRPPVLPATGASPMQVAESLFNESSTHNDFCGASISIPFDSPFRADSPASSFGRPPLHEYSPFPDSELSAHPRIPRHIHEQHDLFPDSHGTQRFWSKNPWDGDAPEHRPLFSPRDRPNYSPSTASLDIVRGPGSINGMDMNGFNFEDDSLIVPVSPSKFSQGP